MDWLAMVREVVAELEGPRRPQRIEDDDAEARRFLQELDPESQEGLWFDALVDSYGSRLAAARAYIREVRRR